VRREQNGTATSAPSMAAMVTFFPGVCSAQAGMSLTGAVAVCAKVTEGTEYSASPY